MEQMGQMEQMEQTPKDKDDFFRHPP